jgi:hypothetical protein
MMADWRTGHRQRYSLSYKREVVAATCAPSATVSSVARQYGLNANMVFAWRRDPRLRENAADAAPAGTRFVPMVVNDFGPATPPAGNDAAGLGRVVIDLPSGARVAIEDTQDVGALVTLLRGLAR